MGRPLDQGVSATRKDIDSLLRISRRISEDPGRSQREKDELVDRLDYVVKALLSEKRTRRQSNRAA